MILVNYCDLIVKLMTVVSGYWSQTAAGLCRGWGLRRAEGTHVFWRHPLGQSSSAPCSRASSFSTCKLRRFWESLEPVYGRVPCWLVVLWSDLHWAKCHFIDKCFVRWFLLQISHAPWFYPRLWRFINHLLTYSLTYFYEVKCMWNVDCFPCLIRFCKLACILIASCTFIKIE